MFGRRRAKRAAAAAAVVPPEMPYCGQVYLFQRDRKDREALDRADAAASTTEEVDEHRPPG